MKKAKNAKTGGAARIIAGDECAASRRMNNAPVSVYWLSLITDQGPAIVAEDLNGGCTMGAAVALPMDGAVSLWESDLHPTMVDRFGWGVGADTVFVQGLFVKRLKAFQIL